MRQAIEAFWQSTVAQSTFVQNGNPSELKQWIVDENESSEHIIGTCKVLI